MINVVYLVLVLSTGKGLTVDKIPQANMAQCQVNAKSMNSIYYRTDGGYVVQAKAYCIVGVK